MAADLVLGVDCSTTSCKAIAWDLEGHIVAEGRAAIPLDNPEPDAWQQDARTWWSAFCEATRALCAAIDPARLCAMCVTHQRETFVVTDAAGEPVHPALVWMDHRCGEQVREAVAALGAETLHQLSGKPACTTPSFYKLLFLRARHAEASAADVRVLDVHAFIVERLTGVFATSLAAADPMGMVDMEARTWSAPLLAHAGLVSSQMPSLHEPGERLGAVTEQGSEETGLPVGLAVIAGAGDGQCAGLGAGIDTPPNQGRGRAYLNLGTAIVSGVLSDVYRCDPAFRTLYGAAPGTYFLETDLHGGTFIVNWLTERLGDFDLATLAEEACAIPAGSDGLVVVPYWAGVMNPYWDENATGVTLGWRGSHRAAHLYRAVLEGIALEQRLHTEGVETVTGPITELVVMGGGSRSDLWCQVLADTMNKRVVRSATTEATALGAGILAAVGTGAFANATEACEAMTGTGATFVPGSQQPFYDRLYREVYRGLYEDLAQRMHRLAELRITQDP